MPLDIEENEVLQLVTSAQTLPTLPEVATKVVEATTESETTVNEVSTLIEKDMALSAKLLRVINSPFYGFSRGITNINEAVSLMGFKQVANIALGLSAMSSLPCVVAPGFDYEMFWEHSLTRAVAAVLVTALVRPEASHSIFTIALLQNMGSYLLVRQFPILHGYALALADEKSIPVARAERDAFGTDHAEIGARLAEHWNLPPNMVLPIRYHHYLDLDEELDSDVKDLNLSFSVNLLNVSSLITDAIYGANPDSSRALFLDRGEQLLDLDRRDAEGILERLPSEISSVRQLFQPESEAEPSAAPSAAPSAHSYHEICPECETVNGSDHKFCRECGASLREVIIKQAAPNLGKRILIAEDSAATRTAISAMLKRMGYDVVVALNGEEAVEMARQEKPDLILMDIMMPLMDGIEALKLIRGDIRLRAIPIVMLTSTTDVRMVTEAIESGANDYIAKPFSVTLLTERVERYIHAR